jgi:glycosyltransferase involved in cell wall biosynthesis
LQSGLPETHELRISCELLYGFHLRHVLRSYAIGLINYRLVIFHDATMLIDITRLVDRAIRGVEATGLDRVALAYVLEFHERATAVLRYAGCWIELSQWNSQRVFAALLAGRKFPTGRIRRLIAADLALRWGKTLPAELLHVDQNGLEDPAFERQLARRRLQPLYFLHDLIPIAHPEHCRPGEAARHRCRVETMLTTGRALIVNSQATRDAVELFAVQRGFKMPPLAVAAIAPTALPSPAQQRPLVPAYFIVVGTIEPRKNHLLLLHLWRNMVAQLGGRTPRLVIIGQRGWECEQVVDMLDRCPALRGFVHEQPQCSDAQLATWLHHAQALLFPSFAEGYGLPLVEALTQRLPIIASNLPVFREFAGDIPEYLDPLDAPGWRQLILEYRNSESPMRQAQLQRMRGFVAPTWDEHFSVVDDLIARVMHSPS